MDTSEPAPATGAFTDRRAQRLARFHRQDFRFRLPAARRPGLRGGACTDI